MKKYDLRKLNVHRDMNPERRSIQREVVLKHLQEYGTITNEEAQVFYGMKRGATPPIDQLRKMGYLIDTYISSSEETIYTMDTVLDDDNILFALVTTQGLKYQHEITEEDLDERNALQESRKKEEGIQ
mgnify:CR=1 FL=1|jgi:hypothetical protein